LGQAKAQARARARVKVQVEAREKALERALERAQERAQGMVRVKDQAKALGLDQEWALEMALGQGWDLAQG